MRLTLIVGLALVSLVLSASSPALARRRGSESAIGGPDYWTALTSRAAPALSTRIAVTTTEDELRTNGQCSFHEALENQNAVWSAPHAKVTAPYPDCPAGLEYAAIELPAGKYLINQSSTDCEPGTPGCWLDAIAQRLDLSMNQLTILGQGPHATFIDGGGKGLVFEVAPTAHIVMTGLTIQHSEQCPIHNAGALELDAVHIQDNGTTGFGWYVYECGGIHNEGVLTVTNAIVRRNGTFGSGGGIHNAKPGLLTLTDVTLNANQAARGAGLYTTWNAALDRVTISQNGATARSPYQGGGIFNDSEQFAEVFLTNVTVSTNLASHSGGGIYSRGAGKAYLRNVTVASNGAASAGGIYVESGVFSLWNVLLAPNLGGNCGGGPMLVQTGNLSSDGTCGVQFTGPYNRSNVDPMLGPLTDNGGPTLTHAPQYGSPAVDHGDACGSSDQRGEPRPQDGDSDGKAQCDIGAVELKGGSFIILPQP